MAAVGKWHLFNRLNGTGTICGTNSRSAMESMADTQVILASFLFTNVAAASASAVVAATVAAASGTKLHDCDFVTYGFDQLYRVMFCRGHTGIEQSDRRSRSLL